MPRLITIYVGSPHERRVQSMDGTDRLSRHAHLSLCVGYSNNHNILFTKKIHAIENFINK